MMGALTMLADAEEPKRVIAAPQRYCAASVFFATRDGHSRSIATRIAARLTAEGLPATAHDLAVAMPSQDELAAASLLVLVAAVRYGSHLPEAGRFLAACGQLSSPPPLALASVNLTARKTDKATAETNPYLRKLLARSPAKPAVAVALAGRLDYPRYRWWDRQLIRLIMWLTGGPTDPNTCVVYTSWRAVDDFASQLVELASRAPPTRRPGLF